MPKPVFPLTQPLHPALVLFERGEKHQPDAAALAADDFLIDQEASDITRGKLVELSGFGDGDPLLLGQPLSP